jgi:ubiquinone/menaquinone biosynthesis C-methylase UbiE
LKGIATPDCTVLDAGCGSAVFFVVAAPRCRKAVAFDASPEMIRISRDKQARGGLENLEFLQLRLAQLSDLSE